ncbi:transcriptional regulator, TetR family [Roseovarius azorensis]|uniref:Transcriptional regulator, TetR family n=1 Tax=Roseovarius azorensis TaxID=1287727 RepID=A0A1H7M7B4_9RHOB|nr:TetR/AcrR family transcriptional regulator [Roseovarius azorensis]SEL06497.1 transcriptional regulator, TetR family [Roseovarius azorensis]
MARPVLIEDDALLAKLSRAFREVGYDGATVAILASATGLKKASLYHRFPGGKEQMARDVLSAAEAWLQARVIAVLRAQGRPQDRVAAMADALDSFYSGGKQSCLVNVLSADFGTTGPFSDQVRRLVRDLSEAISLVMQDAGMGAQDADLMAEQLLCELQGSLVLSRVLGTTRPFENFLLRLRDLPEQAGRLRP